MTATLLLPPPVSDPADAPPLRPLKPGERMDREEFHTRYEAMPGDDKFELVEGVVYMASPVHGRHSKSHNKLDMVSGYFEATTRGVESRTDGTVNLHRQGEPRPDVTVRLLPEFGGRTRTDANGCPVGGPELIIEVADSTEGFDLGPKRRDYRAAGVLEYVVVCVDSNRFRAFDLPTDTERGPDADGVWRSKVFPGLWIDAAAALSADAARLLETIRAGTASPGHAEFVAKLQAGRQTP